jgi:hypothetical protein
MPYERREHQPVGLSAIYLRGNSNIGGNCDRELAQRLAVNLCLGGRVKPKTTIATMKTDPRLSMQAKVLYRNRDGQISDVTDQNIFGLKKFAEDGALALHILNNCMKRLDLLSMAAETRPHIDAGLVRLAVDDLRSELEDGSHLAGYVGLTHELFSNSEALAPRQRSNLKTTGRALSRTAAH